MASPAGSSSSESHLQLVVHDGAQQPEAENGNHLSVQYIDEETVDVHYRGHVDGYLHSFPTGFRFDPHDDELLDAYLRNKVVGLPMPINCIKDVNIYKRSPQKLSETYKPLDESERVWYFFTPRDRKYPNGTRPDRAADNGYWKATGADKEVKHPTTGELLGTRKALVFYEGKPPKGSKTNWLMHEYKLDNVTPRPRLDKDDMKLDDCTLVRIYDKTDRGSKTNGKATIGQNEEVLSNKEPSPDIIEDDISPKSNPSNDVSGEDGEGGKEMPIWLNENIDTENAVCGVLRNPFPASWDDMGPGYNNNIGGSLDSVTANHYQHQMGSSYHLESRHQTPNSSVFQHNSFDMMNENLFTANHYQHHTGNTYHLESLHQTPHSNFIRRTNFDVKNEDPVTANHHQKHISSRYNLESFHQASNSNVIRQNSFEEDYVSMNVGQYSEDKNGESFVNFWLVDHPPSLPLSPLLPMTFPPPLPTSLPPSGSSLPPNQ